VGINLSAVELRHLRYFVAVAEMENVSRATRITLRQRLDGELCLTKQIVYKPDLMNSAERLGK
jgi:hypothetical protein